VKVTLKQADADWLRRGGHWLVEERSAQIGGCVWQRRI